MIELTENEIKEINKKCPNEWGDNEQGIFLQPYGVPDHVKGLVVYTRWRSGGISGGSCYDNSNPTRDKSEPRPANAMKVLDILLETKAPNLTYLQYRRIQDLLHTNEETQWEYYGNCNDYVIEYIVLRELLELLESFKND